MATTVNILDAINGEALAYQKAKARYEEEFLQFSMRVPPLEPGYFWSMAYSFRLEVLRAMNRRTEGVPEAAADEFMRQAAIGQSPYKFEEVVHFALSWRHYKGLAYAGGDKCGFGFDRGDDGYSDLMDAVPLLSQSFNERLQAGNFRDLDEFNNEVKSVCAGSVTEQEFPFNYAETPHANRVALVSRLRKMVLQGENYFGMMLEEAAQKWVAYEAIKKERDE